jgi:hypothetical protein
LAEEYVLKGWMPAGLLMEPTDPSTPDEMQSMSEDQNDLRAFRSEDCDSFGPHDLF